MAVPYIRGHQIIDLRNDANYNFEVAPQGEGQLRGVLVEVLDNGSPATFTNAKVRIEGVNGGGYNVQNDCSFEPGHEPYNNFIDIPFKDGILDCAGIGKYVINISENTADGDYILSFPFNIVVTEMPLGVDRVIESDSYQTLNRLIAKASVLNLYIRYAPTNDPSINDMNVAPGDNRNYIGFLVTDNVEDITVKSNYTWSVYKSRVIGYTYKYASQTTFNPSSPPTSWSTTIPTSIPGGGGLWVKTTVNYADGTSYDFTVCTAYGVPAGFGTPTYSMSSSAGNPSVVVTASGADTAKIFDFAFKVRGSEWKAGTVISSAGTITSLNSSNTVVGDIYLNTSTGSIYRCTAVTSTNSTWEFLIILDAKTRPTYTMLFDINSSSITLNIVNDMFNSSSTYSYKLNVSTSNSNIRLISTNLTIPSTGNGTISIIFDANTVPSSGATGLLEIERYPS